MGSGSAKAGASSARSAASPATAQRPSSDLPSVFSPIGLGQSLFSNHAPVRMRAGCAGCTMAAAGHVLPLADPVIGADGEGGSIWAPLVDALLGAGDAARAVVTVLAASGLPIGAFLPGGPLFRRLEAEVRWRSAGGLDTSHVLIQQGQGDLREHTPPAVYADRLAEVVRGVRGLLPGVPVVVAVDSYRGGVAHGWLAEAQRVGAARGGALLGPDLDQVLGSAHRRDGTHYDAVGQRAAAEAWAHAIRRIDGAREAS